MNHPLRLRGSLLLPSGEDAFQYLPDAALLTDARGHVTYAGPFADKPPGLDDRSFHKVGLLTPPLLDCHIHIPQHPIRGRFVEGIPDNPPPPQGRLLAGLDRNVFPAEARCADPGYTRDLVAEFLRETRARGTHGGVAYMTSHPAAARIALESLPPTWRLGLVLMDANCPPSLRIDLDDARTAMAALARDFGQRLIITDRFAVACSSPLRRAGVEIAQHFNLQTQTHLSEQPGELAKVAEMYPWAQNYTDVYAQDGLLLEGALMAHCIHLSPPEWELLARRKAHIVHCPVSNTLLSSGTMPLDDVYAHGLDYALCTDVGASPTTSLWHEMGHFLQVHHGKSRHATPSAALYRCTTAAARIARLPPAGLTPGHPFAATEILTPPSLPPTADDIIRTLATAPPPDIESRAIRIWP